MQCEVWSVKEAVGSEKCEVWSVKCEVWSVKFKFGVRRAQCEVWSVKCEVWSVKEAVRSVKCEVWSVKFEVWSAKSAVSSVRCGVSREGHGRTGCLWTIGHLCLGNFRRRLARVYVIFSLHSGKSSRFQQLTSCYVYFQNWTEFVQMTGRYRCREKTPRGKGESRLFARRAAEIRFRITFRWSRLF